MKVYKKLIIVSLPEVPESRWKSETNERAKRNIQESTRSPIFFRRFSRPRVLVSCKGIVNSSVYKFQFRIHCINIINTSEKRV